MTGLLRYIDTAHLHHGYLLVGQKESIKQVLFKLIKDELGIQTVGNPDFSFFEYNTLTIDDARLLAETQNRKDFGSNKKLFIIATNIITEEAQNALLKVFEEPTPGTHFFIIASQNTYLPTFLSRVIVLKSEDIGGIKQESVLEKSLSERLAFVTKLAGDISDEKQVKQDAIDFVNAIEWELSKMGSEHNFKALRECQFARNALFSRGAMIKMILENLMLQI